VTICVVSVHSLTCWWQVFAVDTEDHLLMGEHLSVVMAVWVGTFPLVLQYSPGVVVVDHVVVAAVADHVAGFWESG